MVRFREGLGIRVNALVWLEDNGVNRPRISSGPEVGRYGFRQVLALSQAVFRNGVESFRRDSDAVFIAEHCHAAETASDAGTFQTQYDFVTLGFLRSEDQCGSR